MLPSQYEQSMKQKNFFLLPNAIFELRLNEYEFYIYAYLVRIEDWNICFTISGTLLQP